MKGDMRKIIVMMFCVVASVASAEEAAAGEDSSLVSTNKSHITTKIFRLTHANAVEVADKFNTMWNGEFGQKFKVTKMAVAFEESNTLMLTAPEIILEACEKAINELDVEAKQVYIEARFVELSNDVFHDTGIDWSMLDGMRGSVSLGGGIQENRIGRGVSEYNRTFENG